MSTYTQVYYHIVFSTKNRAPALAPAGRESLFRYVWGIINKRKSRLYRINGTLDHLHMLTSPHPTICLADFVMKSKAAHHIGSKQSVFSLDFPTGRTDTEHSPTR